jgi:DNA-binding LacI/PurR family transcriptional regulator
MVPAKRGVVTMTDMANSLGLSRVTVSAVLNNRHRKAGISDETADKVKEAARELGYYRNDLAMAMKSGRNQVIGAIVSKLAHGWVGRILSGVLHWSRESDYLIKVEEVSGVEAERAALSRLVGQRVAGILCCNFHPADGFSTELAKAAASYAMPVVTVSSNPSLPGLRVMSDDYAGSARAVEYLWGLGHRRICYIGGDEPHGWVRDRTIGFIDTFKKLGGDAKPDTVMMVDYDVAKFEVLIRQLLSKKRGRPTAILCVNEMLAGISLRVARSLGIDVPEQLSVIGYDGGFAAFTDPPLTSLEQPFEEMGRRSMEELIACIKAGPPPRPRKPESILLPVDFKVRGSTGSVR